MVRVCGVSGCDKPARGRVCTMHSQRYRKYGTYDRICSSSGCTAPAVTQRGRCLEHRGSINGNGYRHFQTARGKFIAEHRMVMEQKLGRPLRPGENVHHINGDKLDNRPENLELWTRRQPVGQRVDDKIAWAIEFLREYGYEVRGG